MTKKITLSVAAAASLLFSASASALEPCKSYVKVEGGYSLGYNTKIDGKGVKDPVATTIAPTTLSGPLTKSAYGMISSVGLGYAFNDAMRGEISFNFNPNMRSTFRGLLIETRELGGDGTLIYDWNNNTPVTPFVFGSVGTMHIKSKIKTHLKSVDNTWNMQAADQLALVELTSAGAYTTTGTDKLLTLKTSLSSKNKTLMTYKAGFGLSMKASDAVSIQLKYGVGGRLKYTPIKDLSLVKILSADAKTAVAADVKNNLSITELRLKKQLDQSMTVGFTFAL